MKRIYVELLKQDLIKHHEYADTYIGVWDSSKGKWMIDGNAGMYEWDKEMFNLKHEKYVSLTCYLHYWNNEYFKQAYKELVEDGILIPLYDEKRHKTLYKFMGIDYEECKQEVYKDVWNNGPSCPPELQKMNNQLMCTEWWKALKEAFYEEYTGKEKLENLQLHHKTDESYKKVVDTFVSGVQTDKALVILRNDLELLTEEEHCKAHNRRYENKFEKE